jgi:hypothetical protein
MAKGKALRLHNNNNNNYNNNNNKRILACILIDVAISGDRNVSKKETKTLQKKYSACGM